jgi:hypothetical protein
VVFVVFPGGFPARMNEPTLQDALSEIEILKSQLRALDVLDLQSQYNSLATQIAELRGIRIAKHKSSKKVNIPALLKALDAQVKGDRGKAMREYSKHYSFPT